MVIDYMPDELESEKKYILFWTKFFGNDFVPESGEDYLRSVKCPVINCVFTNNKNLFESHKFDAIVFHGAENWKLMSLPETRSPHQLYVIALKE